MAGGGGIGLGKDTGAESTCTTSSWKSRGGFVVCEPSIAEGSGAELFVTGDGLLFGLGCLGARGGGNS